MKKTIFKLLLVLFLLVIYMYILVWQNLPNELVVFEGEKINLKTILGMNIKTNQEKQETIETSYTVEPKLITRRFRVSGL